MRQFLRIFFIVLAVLTHLLPMLYLCLNIGNVHTDIFGEVLHSVVRQYPSSGSPAEWTYYVFFPLWVLQLIWLAFAVRNLFHRATDGRFAFEHDVISLAVLICFSVVNVLLTAWMHLLSRHMIILSMVAAILITALLISALVRSCRNLYTELPDLLRAGLSLEVWLVRVFVNNGLASYAVFVFLVMLENSVAVLCYRLNVDGPAVLYVTTSAMALLNIVLFWLDVAFFDNYTRYTVVPYAILLYFLGGMFAVSYNLHTNLAKSVLLICSAACGGVLAISKILLTWQRHRKLPLDHRYSYDITETDIGDNE